ncbi:B9 domain-containing protein 1 [Plasmodiophora brassicae]
MAESSFFVMVSGQVDSCTMLGVDTLYCRYSFRYGHDWTYMHGLEYGMSQIAKTSGASGGRFLWNYPIDLTMRSTNPSGWPKLVVSVYGFNMFGKDVVRGYGFVHVPTTPGRHERHVRLYRPRSSSICQQVMAWIHGTPPEYFDSNFVAQGQGRDVTRVQSTGVVKVVFNVVTKNMGAFGYSVRDCMTQALNEDTHEKAA